MSRRPQDTGRAIAPVAWLGAAPLSPPLWDRECPSCGYWLGHHPRCGRAEALAWEGPRDEGGAS